MLKHQPRKGFTIHILLAIIGIIFFTFIITPCHAQTAAVNYNAIIQQADQALAAKDYPTALVLYEKAQHAKPELNYASGKMTEINTLLDADPDLKSKLVENIIIKAENLYKQKDYALAKAEYQKAITLDPSAQYPKDRLTQISAIYTDPSDQAYFNDAVSNGDNALAAFDFDRAILYYETALSVKPDAKTIKDKITVVKKQKDDYKLKTDQVTKIIAGADKLLQTGKRTEARSEYQKAIDLTPANSYAKQKIQEIDKYAADKKGLQDSYDKFIEQADAFYINRDFANARFKYQEALNAKPDARYPKEMLDKTKSGETQLLSEQEKYDAALASAETLLKASDYPGALAGFKAASAIKPSENYPKTRITEIEKTIAEHASRKEAFDIAIKNGDQALGDKKYQSALGYYKNALSLLPDEKYPTQKITEINTILEQLKTLEENYKKTLADADKLFTANKYEEAITSYNKALELKPDETYPKQKITEAQTLIAAARSKDENYTAAIAIADKALIDKKYDDALAAYKQALTIKPSEKYPKDKSDEIIKILATQKADADAYALAIANGDKAMTAKNYNLALTSFQDALKIKPDEQYPQDKITAIKAKMATQQQIDEQYTTTINTGNQLFGNKEYELALVAYNDAAKLKKDEKYPQEQIAKINKLLGDMRTTEESYTQAVKEGDNSFSSVKYADALASYKKALTFKPAETYPQSQIDKINQLLAEQKKLDADYQAVLASADKSLAAKKYDEAIADYKKALAFKPSEKYPQDKIAEAQKQIDDLAALQKSYDKAVADGDKSFTDKDYQNALTAYKSAGALKPTEAYPKQKITEVQGILDKDKAEGQRYQEAIAQADKSFTDKKYQEALDAYQKASGIKPAEKYPQEQITKVNQLIAEQKKLDDDYQKLLVDADVQFRASKYTEARKLYSDAGALKPIEKLPKDKITEIDGIIADLQSKEQNYTKHISEGDAGFAAKKYDEAIAAYNSALKIKPTEAYPQSQIDKINSLVVEIKKQDADYTAAVAAADKSLAANKYDDAIADYKKALALKPSEKYPQDKIAEAEKKIADLKALQQAYDKAIADADKSLSGKDYVNALASYKSAGDLKPSEAYPKQKITEVQAIMDKDKAEGQRYQEAIAQADKSFTDKKYQEALDAYQKASGIKPAEKHPQEQITKVNQLIAEQKKLDDDYQKLLVDADVQFKASKYTEARKLYADAGLLKPIEKLPKDKITEIDGIIADLQSKEQNYTKHISEGDAGFAAKKYDEAIAAYNSALKIKPTEAYPQSQIDKINSLVAEIKKQDADYTAAVAAADKSLAANKYDDAITDYKKALTLKPSEKYPQDKIAEAEKKIADLKALQQAYDKAIADADKSLSGKDYVNALASYKSAGDLKPSEAYPKQKITEVQAIMDKDKAEGQRYQEAIAQADKSFTDKKYAEAITSYQNALTIKSAEKYPVDQIVKINQLIADEKKLDDNYDKAMADADVQFKAGKFDEAKSLYNNALALKPSEKLPKDKIAEIDSLLADKQKKDQDYSKSISEGDGLLADKKFEAAITAYNHALTVKPSEQYPTTQIDKINKLIAEQKKLDEDYQSEIAVADNLFDSKKYTEAITAYKKATALKPSEKYPVDRIAETEKDIADMKAQQDSYDKAIAEGDKKMIAKDYDNALAAFKSAVSIKPAEEYPAKKITEVQTIIDKQKAEAASYQEAITLADKYFKSEKYSEALEPYQRATTINPSEKYPKDQIAAINKLLAEQKKLDDDYQKLLTDADDLAKATKYTEARALYNNASTLKPTEKLPKDKMGEMDGIIAALKQKDENYSKAINTASEQYTAKNFTGALKSYEDALAIKPAEKMPQERIASIKAELKAIDDNYAKAIALGDSKLASKDLMEALNAYQNALEIKVNEDYPKSKIAEINTALANQKEEQEKLYASYVSSGDQAFANKDYAVAKSSFTKAGGIKPAEAYPKQQLVIINKIIEDLEIARKTEYTKALGQADKLYNTKIFDQAIDAYEVAAKINPDDNYPGLQISKIRKYMTDHAIQDLYSEPLVINEGGEKKFTFASIEPRLRKNNYILLKVRSTGKTTPKVYLNYGQGNLKNGGIVLRSIDKNTISDYLIRISVQDKWYREDNNWISLYVEIGDIEITKVQIAAGDE